MKKILFVGAEVMPFAATGGLGDVLGSLPAALKKEYKEDIDIRVVLPLYDAIKAEWRNQMKLEAVFNLQLSWRNLYCGIHSLEKDGVIDKLREAGAKEGDTICMGNLEFELVD